ncbi:hypothetical protein J4482_01280 [Candidatus Woesearchaeota archaeon]|nr:hypothetical protein [uncultured archaeon]AQS32047.1 hypothetical protein [uncultured archaeon]MBS3115240.1 hypothetical protein [Candidatus Woesearchaeota archaeon]
MIEPLNLWFGLTIIAINLVPILFRKWKYFQITIPVSLLLGAIKVLFL